MLHRNIRGVVVDDKPAGANGNSLNKPDKKGYVSFVKLGEISAANCRPSTREG